MKLKRCQDEPAGGDKDPKATLANQKIKLFLVIFSIAGTCEPFVQELPL